MTLFSILDLIDKYRELTISILGFLTALIGLLSFLLKRSGTKVESVMHAVSQVTSIPTATSKSDSGEKLTIGAVIGIFFGTYLLFVIATWALMAFCYGSLEGPLWFNRWAYLIAPALGGAIAFVLALIQYFRRMETVGGRGGLILLSTLVVHTLIVYLMIYTLNQEKSASGQPNAPKTLSEAEWRAKWKEQLNEFTLAVDKEPNNVAHRIRLADFLAEMSDESIRNGPKALEHATKACELSLWKDPKALESLASAYATMGQFDKAIEWQEKAIVLANGDNSKLHIPYLHVPNRLERYKEKRPLCEVISNPPPVTPKVPNPLPVTPNVPK